jgi:hypothetical protein
MLSGIKEGIKAIFVVARTLVRRFRGGSDYQRWCDARSLSPDWDKRTERIAQLIPPGAAVLEFGAGRMTLKDHLPEGCRYTPSDLVDRGHGTIVCDLNVRNLPVFPRHDVAIFSGVLEYINDVGVLVQHLYQSVDVIITSYVVLGDRPRRLERRLQGWVNDYTSSELEGLFAGSGFRRDHVENWGTERIFRFIRIGTMATTAAATGRSLSASSSANGNFASQSEIPDHGAFRSGDAHD